MKVLKGPLESFRTALEGMMRGPGRSFEGGPGRWVYIPAPGMMDYPLAYFGRGYRYMSDPGVVGECLIIILIFKKSEARSQKRGDINGRLSSPQKLAIGAGVSRG